MDKPVITQRLVSLDILRGFDMFWIIGADELFQALAKATGNSFFKTIAGQLDHAGWNGFTAYDMVFPLFLFIAGVATPFSVGRELEKGIAKQQVLFRIFKRALVLVVLGFIYNNGLAINPLEKLRFPSVLGRIGLAYLFANIIYLYAGKNARAIWFVALLTGYWLLLKSTAAPGFAAGDLSMEGNIVSYVDRLLLPGSLYLKIHDPEGILSTIPAIGTGLLGIITGDFLKNSLSAPARKAASLCITGILFIMIAQVWNLVFPINKNLWTSSFALQAGGISLVLLSLFYYIIDVKGYQKWGFFFKVIGMNSILIYMSAVFIHWGFTANAFLGWLPQLIGQPFNLAAVIVCIMAVKWVFLYCMYKKKLFLKV